MRRYERGWLVRGANVHGRNVVGDVVVTVDGQKVYVGRIAGPPTHVDTPGTLVSRRRPVRWANGDAPAVRRDLPLDARRKLAGQLTVTELTAALSAFEGLTAAPAGGPR